MPITLSKCINKVHFICEIDNNEEQKEFPDIWFQLGDEEKESEFGVAWMKLAPKDYISTVNNIYIYIYSTQLAPKSMLYSS